jgi:hypothetical protein
MRVIDKKFQGRLGKGPALRRADLDWGAYEATAWVWRWRRTPVGPAAMKPVSAPAAAEAARRLETRVESLMEPSGTAQERR